jgi:anaerobic magnesium-protoporphyrin IX monomethyl ester cyclase
MYIALVNVRRSEKPVIPLGLLSLAAMLEKHGFTVTLDDLVYEEEELAFIERLAATKPDIIGFSFLTTAVARTINLVEKVAKAIPDAIRIGGGAHCTGLPGKSLEDINLHYVIAGEGEYPLLDFCTRLRDKKPIDSVSGLVYRSGDRIIENPIGGFIEDLNELPLPAWHLINMENYLFPPGYIKGLFYYRTAFVMTSRGCPAHCIFCSSPGIFGRRIRRRSVENVMNEIRILKERFKVDSIFFLDDTFTLDANWVLEFCKQMKAQNINLPWACQTRVNVVTKSLLQTMKEGGCVQVDYGIESGSDRILKVIKKGTNVEMIKKAFAIAHEVGLRTYGSVLIGNPTETLEDIRMTKELLKEVKPSLTLFNFLTPMPGSELYDMALANGWMSDTYQYLFSYDTRTADVPLMSASMDAATLRAVRSDLQNSVFFRNYMNFLNLRNTRFIADLALACMKHPIMVFKGLLKAFRTRALDDFADAIYYVYCLDKRQ